MDLITLALCGRGGGGGDTSIDLSEYATKNEVNVVNEKINSIRTYQAFPETWNAKATSSYTTKQLCDVINADPIAIEGKTFLGEIRCSDIRGAASGVNLTNGDAVVEIIDGTGTNGKVIHINMSSGNQFPYRWEYTYWNNGQNTSGWIGFYPNQKNGIPITDLAQDVQNKINNDYDISIDENDNEMLVVSNE